MATQVHLPAAVPFRKSPAGIINVPSSFKIRAQDGRLESAPDLPATTTPEPLGVLSNFVGTFAGSGFNLIFRPNSGPPHGTTFTNPVSPLPPIAPSENVLELNLTSETLAFSNNLGSIPNRGLGGQSDIFLNGVPYVQSISDVSNPKTGKGDANPSPIHFEPGLWMHVPATSTDPVLGESLHCGPANHPAVDIRPFPIGVPNGQIHFISTNATQTNTPRLPQDLSAFIAAGTITQNILNDPNTVLRNANVGKNITKTTVFTVSTSPTSPGLGGGTANIAFLQGTQGTTPAPNANAVQMTATFWIEEVEQQVDIPVFKPGQTPVVVAAQAPHPGAQVPVFVVDPPHEVTTPKTITVTSTQIQYSQTVFLNFAGLTWPHVSCAALIPTTELPIPSSAWK